MGKHIPSKGNRSGREGNDNHHESEDCPYVSNILGSWGSSYAHAINVAHEKASITFI